VTQDSLSIITQAACGERSPQSGKQMFQTPFWTDGKCRNPRERTNRHGTTGGRSG